MNISSDLLNKKIKGEINFKIEECLKAQQCLNCGNISLEYLFKDGLCKKAFSLVELMVALIIISLIVSALTPVITKRLTSNGISISSSRIASISKITKEYTSVGEHEFLVPEGVNAIEVTLVSGGDGGEAGESSLKTYEITNVGESVFYVPEHLKNKYAKLTMCGGGGGGGAIGTNICHGGNFTIYQGAGGGGSGGKIENELIKIENKDLINVYVGGGGGMVKGSAPEYTSPSSDVIWDTCMDSLEAGHKYCYNLNKAKSADSNIAGGVGGKTSGLPYQWDAGNGGMLAGGSGGVYLGNCGLAGGGGGGGGATRFGQFGDGFYSLVGGGGGGGGEGLRVQSDGVPTIKYNGSPGGGGGGIFQISSSDYEVRGGGGGWGRELDNGCVAGGGNAGKPNGNNGESSGCNNGANYGTRLVATSGKGGDSPLTNYPNKCAGGHGEGINGTAEGRQYSEDTFWHKTNPRARGLDGIIVLDYIDGSLGGKGGNSGRKIMKTFGVNKGDKITIKIGNKGSGGISSNLDKNGNISASVLATKGEETKLFINDVEKLNTNDSNAIAIDSLEPSTLNGTDGAKDYTMNCANGTGGTNSQLSGNSASGVGGCGGGGGYICSNGGDGAIGYAKIVY